MMVEQLYHVRKLDVSNSSSETINFNIQAIKQPNNQHKSISNNISIILTNFLPKHINNCTYIFSNFNQVTYHTRSLIISVTHNTDDSSFKLYSKKKYFFSKFFQTKKFFLSFESKSDKNILEAFLSVQRRIICRLMSIDCQLLITAAKKLSRLAHFSAAVFKFVNYCQVLSIRKNTGWRQLRYNLSYFLLDSIFECFSNFFHPILEYDIVTCFPQRVIESMTHW